MTNQTPARDRLGAVGVAERLVVPPRARTLDPLIKSSAALRQDSDHLRVEFDWTSSANRAVVSLRARHEALLPRRPRAIAGSCW